MEICEKCGKQTDKLMRYCGYCGFSKRNNTLYATYRKVHFERVREISPKGFDNCKSVIISAEMAQRTASSAVKYLYKDDRAIKNQCIEPIQLSSSTSTHRKTPYKRRKQA